MNMKKIFYPVLCFTLTLLMTSWFSCGTSKSGSGGGGGGDGGGGTCTAMTSVVGNWQGRYGTCSIAMRFNTDTSVYMFDGDEVIIGEYSLQGTKLIILVDYDNGKRSCKEIAAGQPGSNDTGVEWQFKVCKVGNNMVLNDSLIMAPVSSTTAIVGVWSANLGLCTDNVQFVAENNFFAQGYNEVKAGIYLLTAVSGNSYKLYRMVTADNGGQSCYEFVHNIPAVNEQWDESTVNITISNGTLNLDNINYQLQP